MKALDIDGAGAIFASGGEDGLVKLWHYDEGDTFAQGTGHSGAINSVKIAPDGRTVVSAGAEGSVMIWTVPDAGAEEAKE